MIDLLLGLPARVWWLLALMVLVPLAVALVAPYTPVGRRIGLAMRITSRAVALMGIGFGVMALVATVAVLGTGLQEIRRRHLPAVVDLAAELGHDHTAPPDSVSFARTLSLFRALQPEVGPAAIWGLSCGVNCLSVAAEPAARLQAEAWAHRLIARPPAPGALRTVILNGELHLVVAGILRDPAGAPEGYVAAGVRAGWVADRALQTALALVVLAYALLLVVGWATRGMLAARVASRVRDLTDRLRGATHAESERAAPDSRDELADLDRVVGAHILGTVERLREADERTTEARALAARMEATTTLAAGVAHDFNNLMAGVMANCELLQLKLGPEHEAARTLARILTCAQRAGRLAQQLVAFARGGRYAPIVMDVNALIEETLRVEGHTLPFGITVERHLAPALLHVEADPVQLTQVISNLHRNAAEAIRQAGGVGRITVTTRNASAEQDAEALTELQAGPYVVITVGDTGHGMSAETRARIFEPFFTTKGAGRGMGLAAAYGIVAHHGGRIAVESAESQGTTFTVHLPATAVTLAPQAATAPAARSPAGAVTVLLVDDEAAILSGYGRLLEHRGYTVLTAASGPEAIQLAETTDGPIHVIVLDLRMPGMSGNDAFGPLVAARPDARVIICSGYELDAHAQALLDRGAVAFVRKPFEFDTLEEAIIAAAGQPT